MKFGAYLQSNIHLPWENEYIQYDKLKFYLKERQLSLTGWTKTDEKYFAENLVAGELDKVYQFIDLNLKIIEPRIKEVQALEVLNDFDPESKSLNMLLAFIEINSSGFQKIVKKHNKWTHSDLSQYTKIRSCQQIFKTYKCRADQLLYDINQSRCEMKNKIDSIRKSKNIKSTISNKRAVVTTYWIHPDNLSEVQATVLFNLPNINANTSTQSLDLLFLDNPLSFTSYNDLVKKEKNAELIHIEWQEEKSNTTASLELGVYKESHINKIEYYINDKFSLQQKHVKEYLDHPIKEQARKMMDIDIPTNKQDKISTVIQKKQLEPIIRSRYSRLIYRASSRSDIQVAIYTNVQFINEIRLKEKYNFKEINTSIDQCIDHSDTQLIQHFPFAIFEIKQDIASNRPESHHIPNWLSELINSGLVYEVPFFLPYLHGISCFYQDKVSLLPWWLSEMKNDIRKGNNTSKTNCTTDNDKEYPITHRNKDDEVGKSKPHSVIVISNEQKQESIQPKQIDKPNEIYGIDLSSFEYTHYNPHDNNTFSSFYRLANGTDFMKDTQNIESKASVAAHEVLLENPVIAKIKNLKENVYSNDYEEPNSKYENIGMGSWLVEKLRRRKSKLSHASMQEISSKQGRPKKKIEPKILFANERTFISWLQFAAFLLTVSLGLINFGDKISKFSGGFFIIISVLLSIYALLRFQYRSWQIRMRNDSRFDDRWGPAVLCVVLVIALIINFGLRLSQPVPANPSLFGQQQDDMLMDKMGSNTSNYNSSIVDDRITPKNGDANWKEHTEDKKKSEHKNEPNDLHRAIYKKPSSNDDDEDDGDDDENN